jgi:hypothetical protein
VPCKEEVLSSNPNSTKKKKEEEKKEEVSVHDHLALLLWAYGNTYITTGVLAEKGLFT